MRMIFVRHGETIQNVRGVFMGQSHGKLSQKGNQQVRRIARYLRSKRIDVVYSSDLRRCRETAGIIKTTLPALRVRYTKSLREHHGGRFQGMHHEQIPWKKLKGTWLTRKPLGGESMREFRDRIRIFFGKFEREHARDTILIISHGGVMHAAYSILTKTPLKRAFVDRPRVENAGVCEIEKQGKAVRIHCWNLTTHLNRKKVAAVKCKEF